MSDRATSWAGKAFVGASPTCIAVLLAMADLADDHGVLTASIPEIAVRADMSFPTIKRTMAKLVRGQSVERQPRRRASTLTILGPEEPQHARKPMLSIPMALRPEVDNA